MKSSTLLDSVVFQLTPTRTRCDLVIIANGKKEKIATGLLDPFLAHLKVAQEQIGKGGYSVTLEPDRSHDVTWFTKGTVERFVRFVSTPEILERVHTIESETLHIEEAISSQKNHNNSTFDTVEDHQGISKDAREGGKPLLGVGEEKAIVLYEPDGHSLEMDGSRKQGNSRVELLRVLQARRSALQKEQGMAFARAVAAGFGIDNLSPLMSFSKCFGASRMMEACSRFMYLWNAKHESGLWHEMETAQKEPCQDFTSLNSSSIVIPTVHENEKHHVEAWAQIGTASDNNGVSAAGVDPKSNRDHQAHANAPEGFGGQFPHPTYSAWPIHPQAGQLPYPMPMPYYQKFPGNGPFFQPPYPLADDSRLGGGQRTRQRRYSMDNSRELNIEYEDGTVDDLDVDESHSGEPRKKGSKSRKQSGMVVIRNFNYISSKKLTPSNSSDDSSASESDVGVHESDANKSNSNMNTKRGGRHSKTGDAPKAFNDEDKASSAADDGQWNAFQSFLMSNADDGDSSVKAGLFLMEGKFQGRKRQNTVSNDHSVLIGRYLSEHPGRRFNNHDVTGNSTRMLKPGDVGTLTSRRNDNGPDFNFRDDVLLVETGAQGSTHWRRAFEDFTVQQSPNLTDVWCPSLDPSIDNGFGSSDKQDRNSSHNVDDESFIIPHRSSSLDQAADDSRVAAMDMNTETTSAGYGQTEGQYIFVPNDLSLMPDRVMENQPVGYDPALDYSLHLEKDLKVPSVSKHKQGSKKLDKDQSSKVERSTAAMRRGKPSKLSLSVEARARAERLRTFKTDLQKLKKEKEAEQTRRLEALKMERQKRIAARSGAIGGQTPLQLNKRPLLSKLSPSSHKGSKFSDTEPGSSSPLQRSTMKRISMVSSVSPKSSKPGRLENGSQAIGNRLTRSVSSLSDRRKVSNDIKPDPTATRERIRRLSEPKSSGQNASVMKTHNAEPASKRRISYGHEIKRNSTTVNPAVRKSAGPELKIKTSKASSETARKKSSTRDSTLSMSGKGISKCSATAKVNEVKNGVSSQSDGDDNTVVEKTVVVLECEKPFVPLIPLSEKGICLQDTQTDECYQQSNMEEDVAIHPHSSFSFFPSTLKETERNALKSQHKEKSHISEAETTDAETSLPKISSMSISEKPYEAPYARVSSIEDPCMVKSDDGKAPLRSLDSTMHLKTTMVHVDDSQMRHVDVPSEASEKTHGKDSSKGLKRLLKLCRKKHGSTVDQASFDSFVADNVAGHSGKVPTLKNLISHDDTTSSTPQKNSRSFSLFSSVRAKTDGEKKSAT